MSGPCAKTYSWCGRLHWLIKKGKHERSSPTRKPPCKVEKRQTNAEPSVLTSSPFNCLFDAVSEIIKFPVYFVLPVEPRRGLALSPAPAPAPRPSIIIMRREGPVSTACAKQSSTCTDKYTENLAHAHAVDTRPSLRIIEGLGPGIRPGRDEANLGLALARA